MTARQASEAIRLLRLDRSIHEVAEITGLTVEQARKANCNHYQRRAVFGEMS